MAQKIIGFDAQPLFRKRDGVGTYTLGFIQAAIKSHPEITFVGLYASMLDEGIFTSLGEHQNLSFKKLPLSWQIVRLLAEFGIWLPVDKLMRLKFDGFVYTNFVCLPWVSKRIPKALVIHDAVYIHYPETVSRPNLYFLRKFVPKSVAKQNTTLFTSSEHAAQDLTTLFDRPFRVASPGPSSNLVDESLKQDTKKPLVFVGTIEPRKNIAALLTAYGRLSDEHKSKHPLIIAGKMGWNSDRIEQALQGSAGVTYLGPVSDAKVDELYSSMFALVFPSLYEGFGIPVLDATLHGKQVLTSKNSSMEEIISSDGGFFVDPHSVDSIYDGLIRLVEASPAVLTKKASIARHASARYDWLNTAKMILSSFQN